MIDLHTHTTISDGIYAPEELVQMAVDCGLTVLCMTDHNALNENLDDLRRKYPQIILPTGCEFSCHYKTSKEHLVQLHIGGIGFDMNDSEIRRIISHNRSSMRPYVEKVLSKLKDNCGIDLCTYADLIERNKNAKTVGRKHVALEMVRQGICADVDDAFDTYLGKNKPAFVSNAPFFVPLAEVTSAVTATGGIASLCHLFEYQLDDEETDELLKYYKSLTHGQGAMEVYYSKYDDRQTAVLKSLADKYSLLYSAASDFHGDGKVKALGKYPDKIFKEMTAVMSDIKNSR